MPGRLSVNMFVVLAVLLVTAAALPARAVIQIYGRDSCSNCQASIGIDKAHPALEKRKDTYS
jgi:hypothetical protein